MKSKAIVNAGIGFWYPKGTQRLYKSLIQHNQLNDYDFVAFNEWPNENYNKECPYNIKASAIERAISMGYKEVLWVDCSMWCIRSVKPIFEAMEKNGLYVANNGYNCAQECSDDCLKYFNTSRDEAEKIMACSSGCIGFDLNNPKGKEFADKWIQSAKDGIYSGSREHDGQSSDPRFLHHRQDQSCASILINKIGLPMDELGHLVSYDQEGKTPSETTVFLCRGM